MRNLLGQKNLILLAILGILVLAVVVAVIFRPQKQAEKNFTVTNIPQLNTVTELAQTFEVEFSQPVKAEEVLLQTDPFTPLIVTQLSPNKIKIAAKGVWLNQRNYTIRILKNTHSGPLGLDKEYLIEFQTNFVAENQGT